MRFRWAGRLGGQGRLEPAPRVPGLEHRFSIPDAFGRAPALVAVARGRDHALTYTNAAYSEIFGDGFPYLADQSFVRLIEDVNRSGEPCSARAARVRLDGGRDGHFTFVCVPIRGRRRDIGGVLVVGVDVTDQVVTNELLRGSEERYRQAAITLQRSLLPQRLHEPDEVAVATRYLPGGNEAEVGGDWYDVIPLGAGRTAFVIGDVMGRGLRAAAIMGQLRAAVRAYARLDLQPHEVLRLLDGLITEIGEPQIVTCVYAVFDPSDHTLDYSAAGHLPPLAILEAGKPAHRLEEASGPPLGVGGWPYVSETCHLEPGSTVAFYTDGLVERRGEDIGQGIDDLVAALEEYNGEPESLADRVLRQMNLPTEHSDDTALLVMQVREFTGDEAQVFRTAAVELMGGGEVATRARAFTTGVLSSWRMPVELAERTVLAVSELVTNALTHGEPPVGLRLRRTRRRLIVEVRDRDEHLPRRRFAGLTDETGRGIMIVSTVASSWGSRKTEHGKAVWCEFPLPG
ncbi:MAG: ATP-binding SpoIIE family protein phosphatase [Carbonactinosporaceae bacterium]